MSRIKCKYTQTPVGGINGEVRWVEPIDGSVYRQEFGGEPQNTRGRLIYAKADGVGNFVFDSMHFKGKQFVLTPVSPIPQQEVPLTKSKCPIRSQFTDAQITAAYMDAGKSVKVGAARLCDPLRDGNSVLTPQVSRQLFRFWCIELGIHVPKEHKAKVVKPKAKTGPRVLLIDIETAPILSYVWSLWKQNVGLNQIAGEWYILSFCAKWLGEPEIIYQDIRHNPHDDTDLMQPLWDLLNEADIIIGQNGKQFDMPKIQARLIMAGFPPPRPYKVIDTLLMARQQFRFTSNKLEWLTDKLTETKKSKHAKFPGFALWAECIKGNPEAWDEMKEYNIPDVTSMEELYIKLRPWYIGHPNMAVYTDSDKLACPKCASTDIQQDGFTFTQVGKYELYHCDSCGGWSRGRYTKNSTAVRKALLSN